MTLRGLWQVQGGDTLGAVRDLLQVLLEDKVVDAVLVPVKGSNHSVMPALVKNPTRLTLADPFAPVMAFNSARLLSMVTRGGAGAKIGAVLRSCEIRALVELSKFNQVDLDDVVIIGMDCLGTLRVPDYLRTAEERLDLTADLLAGAKEGNTDGLDLRTACRMCEVSTPLRADVSIGFIGIDNAQALLVEMREDIAQELQFAPEQSPSERRAAVLARLRATRAAARDAEIEQFRTCTRGQGGLARYFAECLECTNCMNACPICYCKECFFRTANAERTPRDLLRLANRQGALPMPVDALLFQMTRLNHMATSCVGCGMCEAACPHDIPLTAMFRAVGARVQKIFDYEPGRALEERPPFMEFKREELLEIGEPQH
ncbi:MAG: 4Fe-4S dicluster domain-containing protein [Chloroflexi bacterium]|nr:4Fe-4S dicluster domain-containing protein [Chloroflexota bacterium]